MRSRGDRAGEMALVHPTQYHSASIVMEGSLVGKLMRDGVTELATQDPEIYRPLARTLARHLLECNEVIGQHRESIRVFIISSAEAVPVARMIQNALTSASFLVAMWADGVFRATS